MRWSVSDLVSAVARTADGDWSLTEVLVAASESDADKGKAKRIKSVQNDSRGNVIIVFE